MLTNRLLPVACLRIGVVLVIGLLASTPAAVAAKPPNLLGLYFGTYVADRPGATAASMQLEVEKQHGRTLRTSVFAVNQPEFQGQGHLRTDAVHLTFKTKATGNKAPRLNMAATLDGTTIAGTYTLKRHGLPDETGTFSVTR